MFRNIAGATALAVMAFGTSVSAEGTHSDYEAISATIFDYFDGIREADRERLERAFLLDQAHMKSYIRNAEGELVEGAVPITEVIDGEWAVGEGRPELQGRIVSVNIYSDVAAHAVFDYNGEYVDSFQLAKVDGQWKIMNKFFVDK